MIDNLIYDPMKKICMNLELYFESYEFSNFYKFFGIFLNLKSIYLIIIDIINRTVKWKNLKHPITSQSSIQAGGDVAASEAFDHTIKSQSLIVASGTATWHNSIHR